MHCRQAGEKQQQSRYAPHQLPGQFAVIVGSQPALQRFHTAAPLAPGRQLAREGGEFRPQRVQPPLLRPQRLFRADALRLAGPAPPFQVVQLARALLSQVGPLLLCLLQCGNLVQQ